MTEGFGEETLRTWHQEESRVTRCATLTTPAKTVGRRLTPELIDEQIVDVRVPLPILKDTLSVMKLVPHENDAENR